MLSEMKLNRWWKRRVILLIVLMGAGQGVFLSSASGNPTFARKYRTSCQTCHIAYPKLNSFGEAFRLNGYQIPGGDDQVYITEEYVKEEAVSLGADAYKRVFPQAVWPGAIPGSTPVSFRSSARFDYKQDREGAKTDFVAPESLSMLLGGTLGEDISFYGDIGLFAEGDGETEIGRLFIQFDSLFAEQVGREALNVKVGRFEPAAVPFSSHRKLGLSNYGVNAFTLTTANYGFSEEDHDAAAAGADDHGDEEDAETHSINKFSEEDDHDDDHDEGDSVASANSLRSSQVNDLAEISFFGGGGHHGTGLALARSQSGIELNGILLKRLFYATGLVNGTGSETTASGYDNNSNKDFYFRLAYKLGGMPLTGEAADEEGLEELSDGGQNWRDNSLRLGAFAYYGDAEGTSFGGAIPGMSTILETEIGNYYRYGADFSFWWKDLNLFGAYMRGKDDIDVKTVTVIHEDGTRETVDASSIGGLDINNHEFDVWFVEADYVLLPWLHPFIRYDYIDRKNFKTVDRIVPGVVALIRANLKLTLEGQFYPDDEDSNLGMLALDYAF